MDFKRLLLAVLLILMVASFAFAKKNKKKRDKDYTQEISQSQAEEALKKLEGQDDVENGEEETPQQAWQLLEWEDDKNRLVLRYDILIQERDKKGNYVDLMKVETKDNSTQVKIEPPLPPGFYRYSVVSYNLFGIPRVQSEWEDFTIYKAYKPRVNGVSVSANLNSYIYLDYKNDGIISFGGRNFFMPKETEDDVSFSDYILKSNTGASVKPLEILERADNGRRITFKFDMMDLDVGKYNLLVTDASGLTNDPDKGNLLTVRFKKWMDLNISAGYICPIVLFDDTIKTYFEKNIFPLGANARITFFPFKRRWGNLGIGVSASYSYMMLEKSEYKLTSGLACAHLYLAYSHPFFNKRLSLEAHAGAGLSGLLGYKFEFEHDIKSDPQSSLNISFMAGAAGQFFVFKHLYIEVNVDFVMFFIPDDMTFASVMPSAGVGWQF